MSPGNDEGRGTTRSPQETQPQREQDTTGHRILLDTPKNSREQLRVSVSTFKGRELVHVRGWYADDAGELKPGKGIALKAEHLAPVIEALQRAAREVGG